MSHSFCPDTYWGFSSISGQSINKIQVDKIPVVSNENKAHSSVDLQKDKQATLSAGRGFRIYDLALDKK